MPWIARPRKRAVSRMVLTVVGLATAMLAFLAARGGI